MSRLLLVVVLILGHDIFHRNYEERLGLPAWSYSYTGALLLIAICWILLPRKE